MRDFHKYNIDTRNRNSGKVKTICPWCNDTRGHKGDKSLIVNLSTGDCHCFHCGKTIHVPDSAEEEAKRQKAEKRRTATNVPDHFRRPTFDPSKLTLSPEMERYWTQTRCLPQNLLTQLCITEQEEKMPQDNLVEKCLCFNYFEGDRLVNTKFRSMQKHFKMVTGAELIPYNINGILDTQEAIITEGEFDACSFMALGRTDVISVPAGAQSNLTWMDRFVETYFEDKLTIYIAVDEDQAGNLLRHELIRRLGAERCRIVHYGPGCKDGNEHLVKYGAESLRICLQQAEEVPLEGVFTAHDCQEGLRALFDNGLGHGADTGLENFDKNCTFEPGRLMVVTGRPGDGKSEFVDELALRLCLNHEWKVAYYSPENMPVEYHLAKLAEKLIGKQFSAKSYGMTEALYQQSVRWIADNITHILPNENACKIDDILEKARQLVRRRGVRTLVIDPLNRVEQDDGMSELEYIKTLLNKLCRFAMKNKCLVILVAHPRKVNRDTATGKLRRVEMNDINGSANFGNMADYCIDVDRDEHNNLVTIYIDKVRFKHLGSGKTSAKFVYETLSGRYFPCEEDIVHTPEGDRPGPVNTQFDHTNWLKKTEEQTCLFD